MDITGASGAISRSDLARMDSHAEKYYEQIRKRTSDIAAIAKNTGFSVEDIEAIKRHIFIEEHDLGREEMDITLLNHELQELKLMAQDINYADAHIKADQQHSYTRFVRTLNEKEGIK
ncbi:MAG: hypothetical protein FWB80_07780 [Defluviitaleaceae bacterium]|nr:hypothetical protein [Defluviitaleaceae bacterium]